MKWLSDHVMQLVVFSWTAEPDQALQRCLPFITKWTGQQHLRVLFTNSASLLHASKLISQFSSVQSLSHVRFFATPWITARQASLSITNSWSLLKLMPIESVMPSSHLILCHPLLLLLPIPPSIRVFSNESTLRMRIEASKSNTLFFFC